MWILIYFYLFVLFIMHLALYFRLLCFVVWLVERIFHLLHCHSSAHFLRWYFWKTLFPSVNWFRFLSKTETILTLVLGWKVLDFYRINCRTISKYKRLNGSHFIFFKSSSFVVDTITNKWSCWSVEWFKVCDIGDGNNLSTCILLWKGLLM